MDESTIDFILKDRQIDKASGVPLSAVVFMLYYGLELKHFLLELSDEFIQRFPLQQYKVGEDASVYLSGSAAQGLYLNTLYLPDARDIDIVAINKKYPVREKCHYDENAMEEWLFKLGEENPEITNECLSAPRSNATTTECDDRYLNIKVFRDTPIGYVLLQKCRRHPLPVQSMEDLFVSSCKTTEARVQYWHELKTFLRQNFPDLGKDSSLLSYIESHGPAATAFMSSFESTTPFEIDMVFGIPYPKRKDSVSNIWISWPSIANEWLSRERPSGWPSRKLIEEIKQDGCTLIIKGSTGSKMEDFEWRISFTGDLKLARNLTRVQRELLHIIKATISEPEHGSAILDLVATIESYQFQHVLYQESEHIDQKHWIPENIAKMLFHLLDEYLEHFQRGHMNHYFIKSRNIFEKFQSLSEEETDTLVYTILRLRHDPLGQLLQQEKYLRLPSLAHKMVFSPFVQQVKSSGRIQNELFVNTLIRLAKAHLMEGFYLTGNIYATEALKFYRKIPADNDDLTDVDYMDLMLVLAVSSHRAGSRAETLDHLEKLYLVMNKQPHELLIDTFGISTYGHVLGLYAKTLLAFLPDSTENTSRENIINFAVRIYKQARSMDSDNLVLALDTMTVYLHMENLDDFKALVQEILVSYPHLASLLDGSDKKDAESETDSENDVEIIYDRSEFSDVKRRRVEENQIDSKAKIISETDSTQTMFQTNIENSFDKETNFEVASGNFETLFGDMVFEQSDIATPFPETSFIHKELDTYESKTSFHENEDRDCIDIQSNQKPSLSETPISEQKQVDISRSEITGQKLPNGENNVLDQNDKSKHVIKILYDRKQKLGETENENIPFTQSELNMIDIGLFTDYCRIKSYKNLGIVRKVESITERVARKIKEAKRQGQKVSLQMLEAAYKTFYPDKSNPDPAEYFNDFLSKELEHVVYSTADKPLLDKVLVKCFSYEDSDVIKIPTDIHFLHTQIIYHKVINDVVTARNLILQMETKVDDLPFEDIDFCKYLAACHLDLIGETDSANTLFKESQEKYKPLVVKDQVLTWLEQVFDLIIKFEPHNRYLDDIFAV